MQRRISGWEMGEDIADYFCLSLLSCCVLQDFQPCLPAAHQGQLSEYTAHRQLPDLGAVLEYF